MRNVRNRVGSLPVSAFVMMGSVAAAAAFGYLVPAAVWAQAAPAENTQPKDAVRGEGKGKKKRKGKSGRGKSAAAAAKRPRGAPGTAPVLTGIAAILFDPPAEAAHGIELAAAPMAAPVSQAPGDPAPDESPAKDGATPETPPSAQTPGDVPADGSAPGAPPPSDPSPDEAPADGSTPGAPPPSAQVPGDVPAGESAPDAPPTDTAPETPPATEPGSSETAPSDSPSDGSGSGDSPSGTPPSGSSSAGSSDSSSTPSPSGDNGSSGESSGDSSGDGAATAGDSATGSDAAAGGATATAGATAGDNATEPGDSAAAGTGTDGSGTDTASGTQAGTDTTSGTQSGTDTTAGTQTGTDATEGTTTVFPDGAPPTGGATSLPDALATSGDAVEYPFLAHDPEALIASTEAMLDELPALFIPPLDPDLLQFGMSYNLSGGTGTLPGAEASVARCGFNILPEPPAVVDRGFTEPVPGDVGIPLRQGGVGSSSSLAVGDIAYPEGVEPVCCTYDGTTSSYSCGEPGAFSNKQESFRSPSGDQMTLLCIEMPEASVSEAQASLGSDFTFDNGFSLTSGTQCCNLNITELEHIASSGVSVGSPGLDGPGETSSLDYLQDCAPASVAMSTGFGSVDGSFAATTELFGEGGLSLFSESRDDAYTVEVDGRLSLISRIVTGGGSNSYSLRGRFSRLNSTYRRYLARDAAPWFVGGGVDIDNTSFDVTKTGSQDSVNVWDAPGRLSMSAGYGRVYEIEPRVKLRKLEAMLRAQGVINGPIPHEVARDIMIHWWALRSSLGYDQPLLYTLKLLKEAGLLVGPVTTATVYRFGQIFNDGQLVQRRQGSSTLISVNIGKRLRPNSGSGPMTVVIEVEDERVYNISYDMELFWKAVAAYAPRKEDWQDNRLTGQQLPFSGLLGGMVAASVPVGYRLYQYGDYMERLGYMELGVRLGMGYADDDTVVSAPTGFAATVGATGGYTFFQSASHGVSFTTNVDLGRLNGSWIYGVVGGVRMTFGRAASYYVAPAEVGDALPFNLTLPPIIAGY